MRTLIYRKFLRKTSTFTEWLEVFSDHSIEIAVYTKRV